MSARDYAAAEHCYGYDDGNTDWYLPSSQELNVMEDEERYRELQGLDPQFLLVVVGSK